MTEPPTQEETVAVPITLVCPACDGIRPTPCAVCADTGTIDLFGGEHALHRAGGPLVLVEDDMVAIRVPSYADHRMIGIDLPLATFRWLVHHGAVALNQHDEAAR